METNFFNKKEIQEMYDRVQFPADRLEQIASEPMTAMAAKIYRFYAKMLKMGIKEYPESLLLDHFCDCPLIIEALANRNFEKTGTLPNWSILEI